ncbi:MAG: serine/threonine protein kinase [Planctomycetes bacterium]|nr:serine/threonine protein kinase [Planctomycetota bacterium]
MKPDQRDRLGELLESWFVRLDAGETPDPAQHCAEHPELCEEFVRLLGRAAAFDDLFAPRPRADDDTAPPPDQLGEYELIAPIGHGGVGEVWLARQTTLRRLVALKLVKVGDDPKTRRRLRREAEVAAALEHPGIVPVYAVGEQDNRAWIAMKWLTGPALDAVGAPLAPERVAVIGAAVARALHEAHRAGIIHRDVKPSNIVLDGDAPCLVDFGLARDGDDVTRTTAAGHVSGTLLYMSPEQLRSGGETTTLDARTDIYSLGATLYELLSGRAPFLGDHPGKVIHQILEVDPPPLSVARDLATIVLRAMDKDRERRFHTALEMALDLERYLAGQPILSRPVGLTTRVWKLARRNRTATALIGAALLLATGLGASLGWTVYERARRLDSGVMRVQQALSNDDLPSARALLTQLLTEDADAPEVQAAQRRLTTYEKLDDLLDQVQALPEDADPTGLRAVADSIRTEDLLERRRLEYSLARPLALALAGDCAAARPLAEELPACRARDALLAAIATAENDWQETGPWQLQPGKTTVDHLFTALAMRLAQRPLEERRAEVDLARRLDETDLRVKLQHAVQLVNEKQHRPAVEALGAVLRGKEVPRIVRRLLIYESIQLGDRTSARLHLDRFLLDHPRSAWTAADAAYVLDACYWLDAPATELLAFARERWPDDRQVTVLAARAIRDTDPARARKLIEASIDMARTPTQRDASRLTLMLFDVSQMTPFWFPWYDDVDAEGKAWLGQFAARAEALATEAHREEDRLTSSLLQARALLAAGDMAAADAVLSRLDANAPGVVLERAQQACCHYLTARSVDRPNHESWRDAALAAARHVAPEGWRQQVRDVRPRLAIAFETMPTSQLLHGQPAQPVGWLLAALLAVADGDKQAATKALDAARPLLPENEADGYVGLLHYIERMLR